MLKIELSTSGHVRAKCNGLLDYQEDAQVFREELVHKTQEKVTLWDKTQQLDSVSLCTGGRVCVGPGFKG